MRKIFFLSMMLMLDCVMGEELIRRNISWTLEAKNDPIVQITNESEEGKTLTLRLILGKSSYRYRNDFEIPSGENRFIRIRDILDQLGQRYPEVQEVNEGILQLEFEGLDREIKTRIVNLNPKQGITTEKDTDQAVPSPILKSVEPKSGNPLGGTVVTIVGENFEDYTAVKFGGVPAMRTRQSREVLIAIAPPHPAGEVDIEISNGKKTARLEKAFRYDAASPMISRVDPESGPAKGGIRVAIEGRNFVPGSRIRWDGKDVDIRFESDQRLSLVVPPGRSGTVSVEVINPDGKDFVLPDAFRYKGLPQIISLNPQMGSTAGGYTVTINGSNFESGASVMFGGRYGQTTFINSNALAAIVPSGESGFVDVTVTNPDGEIASLSQGFLYNEPPRIQAVTAYPNPILRQTTTTISVDAMDPEAGPLEYEYRVAQGPGGTIIGNGPQVTFVSPNVGGTAVIQVTVYDEYRAKAQSQVHIVIQ